MNAKTLIKKLESNGVKIWIEDDKVKWDAPKGVITDKVLVQMKEKKPELVMILSDKQRTAKLGIKGKNHKKPAKCEVQGDTNKIMNDLGGQVQGIIQEALDMNNKKAKDIMSVVVPLKSVIQKCDVVIKWDTERGDPDPSGSPATPQVNKPDNYDGDQNDEPKIGAVTCQSPRLLPERCSAISPYLNKITLGDCLEKLKDIPENFVDVIVTDPPYGLKFMGKDWDKAVPSIEIWKECLRTLKPGGLAYIMCGSRQDCLSRMIKNLEDAGFRVNFSSLYWTYAQGFSKAHNISKAIDKKFGAERIKIGRNPNSMENCDKTNTVYESGTVGKTAYLTEPATPEGKKFDGAYGGFQPKPAVELIIVAMKPMTEKTYVGQALKNGKGVTWLDDCRVPYQDSINKSNDNKCCEVNGKYEGGKKVLDIPRAGKRTKDFFGKDGKHEPWNASDKGRFPANLLVCDVVLDDGKKRTQGHWAKTKTTGFGKFGGGKSQCYGADEKNKPKNFSRFFSLDAWAEKNLPFLIVPKASKNEKNAGCENIEPKNIYRTNISVKCKKCGKYSVSSNRNNRCECENPEWEKTKQHNFHPTIKPINLMSYLIIMGSRESDVVLDPFTGSGSTCVAAKMLKRKFIGIELDEKYHEIAVKRIKAAKPLMAQSQKRNNQIITQIGGEKMSPRIVKRGDGDYPLAYRPCRMSEVYGQDEVKRTVANGLDKGTLAHAVLFQGVSGTGKTTIGHIIAMGLNCKEGPTSEPCGECDSCKAVLNGNSLAFQEFDAGYLSGIDKMRAARQDFASGPMGLEKFKIILFDECHRLTEPVQTVLLKPIEDSRSHIYFIFCTTNPNRMIETLRNRCMKFEFKELQAEELRNLLCDVCENENVEPDQVTIENIIQESKGMPRNALWLLQSAVGCVKLGSRFESMYASFGY